MLVTSTYQESSYLVTLRYPSIHPLREINRQTNKRIIRHTDRETSKPTYKQTDRLETDSGSVIKTVSLHSINKLSASYSFHLVSDFRDQISSWKPYKPSESPHFRFLQYLIWTRSSSLHGMPPFWGLGESHFRSRDRIPSPQVKLQSDHWPHSPQSPSIAWKKTQLFSLRLHDICYCRFSCDVATFQNLKLPFLLRF